MLTADHGRTHVWIGGLIDRQAEFVEGIRISNAEPPLGLSRPVDRRDMPEIVSYPLCVLLEESAHLLPALALALLTRRSLT
jgi:hypothetical protein